MSYTEQISSFLNHLAKFCQKHLLLTLTLLSVFIGLFAGFSLRGLQLDNQTVQLINFPGEIFMQVLKLMILPLIFSSLISALAQMDARESSQMGLITVGYYLVTTIFAILIGIILVIAIHPGDASIKREMIYDEPSQISHISPLDTFLDAVRNMFPKNVIQATFQRVQTKYYIKGVRGKAEAIQPMAQQNTSQNPVFKKKIEYVHGTNILGIIVFCTGFGIVISQFGEKARIIIEFFVILETVIMKLVGIFMWLTPIGIISLIVGNLLELEDLSETATILLWFVVTVLSGLAIHTIIVMPSLYFLFTRKNPLTVINGMFEALVTSFGTASGGAALPISIWCMEEKLNTDKRATRFVLPLGSTINMDGNALYEAVAVIFIAQLNDITLGITEMITVSFIATIASLGLNSVPAGLVSILVILSTVGLPTRDVPLIITTDWLVDRIRTSINVLGDAYVASTVSHYMKKNRKNGFPTRRIECDRRKNDDFEHRLLPLQLFDPNRRPSSTRSERKLRTERDHNYSRCRSLDDSGVISWKDQIFLEKLSKTIRLSQVKNL